MWRQPAAAQAVEHSEIARYRTLIAWAKQLGRNDCAGVLQKNLDEGRPPDDKVTAPVEARLNLKAAELTESCGQPPEKSRAGELIRPQNVCRRPCDNAALRHCSPRHRASRFPRDRSSRSD